MGVTTATNPPPCTVHSPLSELKSFVVKPQLRRLLKVWVEDSASGAAVHSEWSDLRQHRSAATAGRHEPRGDRSSFLNSWLTISQTRFEGIKIFDSISPFSADFTHYKTKYNPRHRKALWHTAVCQHCIVGDMIIKINQYFFNKVIENNKRVEYSFAS